MNCVLDMIRIWKQTAHTRISRNRQEIWSKTLYVKQQDSEIYLEIQVRSMAFREQDPKHVKTPTISPMRIMIGISSTKLEIIATMQKLEIIKEIIEGLLLVNLRIEMKVRSNKSLIKDKILQGILYKKYLKKDKHKGH